MAANNVSVFNPNGLNQPASLFFKTEASATPIVLGQPVQVGGTGGNFVTLLATAEPTTSEPWMGFAAGDSTHTASANGVLEVVLALPGVVFQCQATTPANIDTEAKILAILNDRVAFDEASGVYTVDEDQGDTSTNGLRITGANPNTGMVYFTAMMASTNLYT